MQADWRPRDRWLNALRKHTRALSFLEEPHQQPLLKVVDAEVAKAVGVSFEVFPNEMFVIFGESGIGKTTLVRVLAGQEGLKRGRVLIRDAAQDVGYHGKTNGNLFGAIQYVPQAPLFIRKNSVLDTARAFGSRFMDEVEDEVFLTYLEWFNLQHSADTLVECLSGGEQMRLAVAIALLAPNLRLLVLDEPLSGLDSRCKKLLLHMLQRVVKCGRSSVFGERLFPLGKTIEQVSVVLTMHQPCASDFASFDACHIIREGCNQEVKSVSGGRVIDMLKEKELDFAHALATWPVPHVKRNSQEAYSFGQTFQIPHREGILDLVFDADKQTGLKTEKALLADQGQSDYFTLDDASCTYRRYPARTRIVPAELSLVEEVRKLTVLLGRELGFESSAHYGLLLIKGQNWATRVWEHNITSFLVLTVCGLIARNEVEKAKDGFASVTLLPGIQLSLMVPVAAGLGTAFSFSRGLMEIYPRCCHFVRTGDFSIVGTLLALLNCILFASVQVVLFIFLFWVVSGLSELSQVSDLLIMIMVNVVTSFLLILTALPLIGSFCKPNAAMTQIYAESHKISQLMLFLCVVSGIMWPMDSVYPALRWLFYLNYLRVLMSALVYKTSLFENLQVDCQIKVESDISSSRLLSSEWLSRAGSDSESDSVAEEGGPRLLQTSTEARADEWAKAIEGFDEAQERNTPQDAVQSERNDEAGAAPGVSITLPADLDVDEAIRYVDVLQAFSKKEKSPDIDTLVSLPLNLMGKCPVRSYELLPFLSSAKPIKVVEFWAILFGWFFSLVFLSFLMLRATVSGAESRNGRKIKKNAKKRKMKTLAAIAAVGVLCLVSNRVFGAR